jgi:hypothetical protein
MRMCDIRKYLFLGVVAAYSGGCFTQSAMRSFDHTLADDSLLTVEQSPEQPASFHYKITTDPAYKGFGEYKGVGWESRLSGSAEIRLPDDITSHCSTIATFMAGPYSDVDCADLRTPAPNPLFPSRGKCNIPKEATPGCSVILVRSTSTDAPVAAYRGDWSPLIVVSQQTPDSGRWLKLAVSPFLDIGAAVVLVVAFTVVGMSAM